MRRLAVVLVVLAVAGVAAQEARADLRAGLDYLRDRQHTNGGFAELGQSPDVGLTGWSVLGLRAARTWPDEPADARTFLSGRSDPAVTDLELRLMALHSLGRDVGTLVRRLQGYRRPSGRIGPTINSTIWGILALRTAGRPAPAASVRFLKRQQAGSGGWSWYAGGQADSNDTAAAIQALRAAGVASSSTTIRRGLAFLRRLQNANGGFELTSGRGSDAPSTAWAIQAFVVGREEAGRRRLPLPAEPPAPRRELPLQPRVRLRARVDDRAGRRRARPPAVSAALRYSGRWTPWSSRSATRSSPATPRTRTRSWLARRLATLGVAVTSISAVRDEVETIAAFVRTESPRTDLLVVTGGLGGTPDDLTREGVAAAFGVACEEVEPLAGELRDRFGPRGLGDYAARWACLPAGAEPLENPAGGAPGFRIENVYVLPGLPSEMRAMFDAVADRFQGTPIASWRRTVRATEGQLVALLVEVTAGHPSVSVGSYPRFDAGGPEVEIVLKSSDEAALRAASVAVESGLADL